MSEITDRLQELAREMHRRSWTSTATCSSNAWHLAPQVFSNPDAKPLP
jgi:hypothetical protein